MKKFIIVNLIVLILLGGCTINSKDVASVDITVEKMQYLFSLLDDAAKDGKLGYDSDNSPGNLYQVAIDDWTLIYHTWYVNDTKHNVMQVYDGHDIKNNWLFLSDMYDSTIDRLLVYQDENDVKPYYGEVKFIDYKADDNSDFAHQRACMLYTVEDLFIELKITDIDMIEYIEKDGN